MSSNDPRPGENPPTRPEAQQKRTVRDVPGCIKYIILLFLLLLFFGEYYAGEYRGFPRVSQIVWLILFIKLLLILLLIILIWVQRQLFCEITSPIGCAIKEYDPILHKWIIRVLGTASGTAFGNYSLSVTLGGISYPMPVIYPGGGSSGTSPVTNGELGRLDVTGIDPDAYRVTLTVNPSGWGSACSTWQEFTILLKSVSITSIGAVTAQIIGLHPDDPTEILKQVKASPDPANPEASVGGSISVGGTADYYGCGRQMSEYVLQHKELPVTHPNTWQQDAADPWADINLPLPFGDTLHPRTYDSIFGTMDNTIKTPNFLTRQWSNVDILQYIDITTPPFLFYDKKWVTTGLAWGTGTAGSSSALNGRYTVRLRVKHQVIIGPPDPTPPELYDAATVWIDNRQIEGRITGMGVSGGIDFSACEELSLSQFVIPGSPATRNNADIKGRAWDPVILDTYVDTSGMPPTTTTIKPNDNFANYTLQFKKDGSVSFVTPPMVTSGTRMPDLLQEAPLALLVDPLPPAPPDTGVLLSWDIVAALDAGPRPDDPAAVAPSPKIYRGERCAYLIRLDVADTTLVSESTVHHIQHDWPFCIMNDIPDDLVPDVVNTPWP
ncbi:MAG: hypothetical protein H7Z16_17465 [Pyrinomonadaceae bacterium]|nr:hypothetical protein [Pyrinomonadaceae bacterium]